MQVLPTIQAHDLRFGKRHSRPEVYKFTCLNKRMKHMWVLLQQIMHFIPIHWFWPDMITYASRIPRTMNTTSFCARSDAFVAIEAVTGVHWIPFRYSALWSGLNNSEPSCGMTDWHLPDPTWGRVWSAATVMSACLVLSHTPVAAVFEQPSRLFAAQSKTETWSAAVHDPLFCHLTVLAKISGIGHLRSGNQARFSD